MSGYFTGVKVPEEVAEQGLRRLPLGTPRVLWTRPENWHATVQWRGDPIFAWSVDLWGEELREQCATIQPFTTRLHTPYVFENQYQYLCATLRGWPAELFTNAHSIAPHVTIGRPALDNPPMLAKVGGWRADEFRRLPALFPDWHTDEWEVTEVHLYHSVGGGRYEIIESIPLGG